MPYNHKEVSGEKYPIQIGGKMLELNEGQMGELIKKKMKSNMAIMKVFDDFDVSPDHLGKLQIEICDDLDGRYAETDETKMSLDKSLFEGGKFMEEKFFICAHEIIHWLTRTRESREYFADNEEREGFLLSIAYEMEEGTPFDVLYNRIFPKIEFHFHDADSAAKFFYGLVGKAKKMLRS